MVNNKWCRIFIFVAFTKLVYLVDSTNILAEKLNKTFPANHISLSPSLKSNWESNMLEFGKRACEQTKNSNQPHDTLLATTYYDAPAVFYKIADYTQDNFWKDCAEIALNIFRDNYVAVHNGKIPGYWNFTHGMLLNYQDTNNPLSLVLINLLSHAASFAADDTPLSSTRSSLKSREVAYAILSYLDAEAAGYPQRIRLFSLVNQSINHLRQWQSGRSPYVRPFMVGLTMQALISYFERTSDRKIIKPIVNMLDWLWKHTWIKRAQAFKYTDRKTSSGGTEPAPDLNLLIAPAFAWAYHHTGLVRFRERGDQIFAGGIYKAWLQNNKQFNQNYRWSFRYIQYRN
jgi:hypothetical protein